MTSDKKPSSHLTERLIPQLVKQARQGDEKSLQKLQELFKGYYMKYLQRLPISSDEKKSIFVLALLKAIDSWEPSKSKFSTWFYWKLRGEIYSIKREIRQSSEYVSLDSLMNEIDTVEDVYNGLEPLTLEVERFEEFTDKEVQLFILLLEYNFDIDYLASKILIDKNRLKEIIQMWIDELGISAN